MLRVALMVATNVCSGNTWQFPVHFGASEDCSTPVRGRQFLPIWFAEKQGLSGLHS